MSVKYSGSGILQQLSNLFPKTIAGATKLIGMKYDNFTQYIVCQFCHSVYSHDLGYVMENGQKIPNTCSHVTMPKHPLPSQRKPCGGILMKSIKVKGRSGNINITLQPNKIFPYQLVISVLKVFIARKGFLDCCEHWRSRSVTAPQFLSDVYDGKVWQDFLVVDGVNFLRSPYNLCLALNVDWFQPFSHTHKWILS